VTPLAITPPEEFQADILLLRSCQLYDFIPFSSPSIMSDLHNTTTAPAEAPVIAEPVFIKPEETIVDPVEETAKPVVDETPVVAASEPIATENVATEVPAAVEEVPVSESVPAVEAAAIAAEETPATTTTEESKAIESGILGYKAPGLIK
jgi:hypothetical protein